MKNQYFDFKQFRIKQDKTSMKVGTDGVLLGCFANCVKEPKQILDIGTGTGLIALMMAQKFPNAKITAIDMDTNSCLQATENSLISPWTNRIKVIHTSLQDFNNNRKFDCILSNPPFYRNAKKSSNVLRAQSRNEEFLPAKSIFEFAKKSLSLNGYLWLIYPAEFLEELNQYANDNQLSMIALHHIRPNILKASHRIIICYCKNPASAIETDITCIEILQRHDYSTEYKQRCKDFYLNF